MFAADPQVSDARERPFRGWRERWLGFRNRCVANPRFQRWAAAFPITRFIARRRARALFDLCAGFVYSQTLLACVRLRLFETLRDGPRRTEALATGMGLSRDAARRLLRAAASLKLVQELPGERYALADLGASMLGNVAVAHFVEHHELFYDDLRDPVALLRGEARTKLSGFWSYSGAMPGANGGARSDPVPYSALMAKTLDLVARDILDAVPLTAYRRLLDVGGGEGAFLAEAAVRAPRLALMLFDLPAVAERAREALQASGLSSRTEVTGGSFLTDPLPRGADILSLVRIVHDHDDESARVLLRAAHAALPPDGTLLLAEPMAETRDAEPIGDAYFGFYFLAIGQGRARSFLELKGHLESAGFADIREVRTRRPLLVRVIMGRRV